MYSVINFSFLLFQITVIISIIVTYHWYLFVLSNILQCCDVTAYANVSNFKVKSISPALDALALPTKTCLFIKTAGPLSRLYTYLFICWQLDLSYYREISTLYNSLLIQVDQYMKMPQPIKRYFLGNPVTSSIDINLHIEVNSNYYLIQLVTNLLFNNYISCLYAITIMQYLT